MEEGCHVWWTLLERGALCQHVYAPNASSVRTPASAAHSDPASAFQSLLLAR